MSGFFRFIFFLIVFVIAGKVATHFGAEFFIREPQPAKEITNSEFQAPNVAETPPPEIPVRKSVEPAPAMPPAKPPPPKPKPIPAPPPPPPAAPPSAPSLTSQQFYERYAPSVVQIFCRTEQAIFSASGVIVNERGLLLTNAHVAEIVRKASPGACQARHGNPAVAFAGLEVIFIADTTLKISGTEVAQRDIAFLRLLEPEGPFGTAAFSTGFVKSGAVLLTLGYPSEFLTGIGTVARSNLVFSSLRVDSYVDVDGNAATGEAYAFDGGLALQRGSSGTALFTPDGAAVGLIFATTHGTTTAEREGVAITASYMDEILRFETGQGLAEFIAGH